MTDEELMPLAEEAILEYARDADLLTIFELFELEDDGDANRVLELIAAARIEISWEGE